MADGPYNPTLMFEDGSMELEMRGREIAHRAVDVSPAAANDQWRPYARMEMKIRGEGCSLHPLYRPFGDSVDSYRARWESERRRQEESSAREKGKPEDQVNQFVGRNTEIAKNAKPAKGNGQSQRRRQPRIAEDVQGDDSAPVSGRKSEKRVPPPLETGRGDIQNEWMVNVEYCKINYGSAPKSFRGTVDKNSNNA